MSDRIKNKTIRIIIVSGVLFIIYYDDNCNTCHHDNNINSEVFSINYHKIYKAIN